MISTNSTQPLHLSGPDEKKIETTLIDVALVSLNRLECFSTNRINCFTLQTVNHQVYARHHRHSFEVSSSPQREAVVEQLSAPTADSSFSSCLHFVTVYFFGCIPLSISRVANEKAHELSLSEIMCDCEGGKLF